MKKDMHDYDESNPHFASVMCIPLGVIFAFHGTYIPYSMDTRGISR